jgi:EF-hand domain pair
MKKTTTLAALLALTAAPMAAAFASSSSASTRRAFVARQPLHSTMQTQFPDSLFFAEEKTSIKVSVSPKKAAPKVAQKENASNHKNGFFSPAVVLTKTVLGEQELNKVRAKAISLHSDIIGDFVATSDSAIGNMVLRRLFVLADKDKNGVICQDELSTALQTLGFDWLKDKQISGIFDRADTNKNGGIDMEEWMKEAPKTLRTNLVKLAKKNGGELGFLV